MDHIGYYEQMLRAQQQMDPLLSFHSPFSASYSTGTTIAIERSPKEKLKLLKKSIKAIEAEPFDGTVRKRIESKANRLHNAGAVAQAVVLENELRRRDSLVALKEWDYKLLTKKAIDEFSSDNVMTIIRDGLKLHIDAIESYVGNPQSGEAKDRIIPDNILDKLEEAKERALFDTFHVLWAEKIKDPLLLGAIDGCEDYFFICEWGDDITFEQLTGKERQE